MAAPSLWLAKVGLLLNDTLLLWGARVVGDRSSFRQLVSLSQGALLADDPDTYGVGLFQRTTYGA